MYIIKKRLNDFTTTSFKETKSDFVRNVPFQILLDMRQNRFGLCKFKHFIVTETEKKQIAFYDAINILFRFALHLFVSWIFFGTLS